MRKQIKMVSLDEVVVSFHDNNNVSVVHGSDNTPAATSTRKFDFDSFDDGVRFFREMIGALYLDGYR